MAGTFWCYFVGIISVLLSTHLGKAELMKWQEANDSRALCNDFSRAGFFIRRNTSSDKWIIYLESGSLCFSNDTCNRRFFRSEFRTGGDRSLNSPYGTFDPLERLRSLEDTPYLEYVNPLMTSMKCLDPNLFMSKDNNIAVEGRDILSTLWDQNRDFYAHNHVLIPYCSSDLWLAEQVLPEEEENHDCTLFTGFKANAAGLQFAFRGKIIYQSIFKQLMSENGMATANSIMLAGSSAGGVGVINLAQWTRQMMPVGAELLLFVDSGWFVNFQDNILRLFEETVNSLSSSSDRGQLLDILYSHPACNDTTFGFPCCFSSQCVLTQRDELGELVYFPDNVRMFFVSSVYDVFLLAPSVVEADGFGMASKDEVTGLLIDFLRLVGEYGGVMNSSLSQTYNSVPTFTYYLTQCFQHIYMATSSLWGVTGETGSVFGSSSINQSNELASFSHSIQSGRWNSNLSLSAKDNISISIQSALHNWYYNNNTDGQTRYLDRCQGPYCNGECPDMFTLGVLTSNNWHYAVKICIASAVLGIGLLSLCMKVLFSLWLFRLEKKQDGYLQQLDEQLSDGYLEFPDCEDNQAIAVSCLDLSYRITFETNKKLKDERTDHTQAVVLNDLTEQNEEATINQKNGTGFHTSRHLRRRSRFVHITETLINKATTLHSPDVEYGMELGAMSPKGNIPPAPPPPPLPPIIPIVNKPEYNSFGCRKRTTKVILKGVSVYFNPGNMIGIMGPSGCGKTTFLDLLTGRRTTGTITGEIYVNGSPMEEIRDWYVANTGYVLQLARPFYEELTVRDNLTLAAQIRLPVTATFTTKEKFKRVEQVLDVSGLTGLADTVVGGDFGPGLSGGQKRRLAIALQLLKLPSVIFLDEPTSGLDATSSMELLSHLNKLADSNRTVILSIHQPRFEIFHMFHKLVLLTEGKVAYHGAPEKAYEVFVSALSARYLEKGLIIPLLQDHNPADVVMDMLGNPSFRQVLTEFYHDSDEPKLVTKAIKVARWHGFDKSESSIDSIGGAVGFALFGTRKVRERHANTFVRLAALEARASMRLHIHQVLFLPFMFFLFAFVLGTVYYQQTQPFLVVSGMCVFSVASGLFVFPAIEPYYTPAIRVYRSERADGVGRAQDLVLQGFIRYISVAFFPVIGSSALIYLLLINSKAYDRLVFLQVVVVNLSLNLTWTAMLISLIVAFPTIAFKLSSAIASVAGFTSGFFIPIEDINWEYRWISYINPNYYGFSSVAFFLLEDYDLCDGTQLKCYLQSGAFTLRQFFFDDINPYLHLVILLGFTIFFLSLGIFANWVRHTSVVSKLRRLRHVIIKKPVDELSKEIKTDREGYVRSMSLVTSLDNDDDMEYEDRVQTELEMENEISPIRNSKSISLDPITEEFEEEEGDEDEMTPRTRVVEKWQSIAGRSLDMESPVTSSLNGETMMTGIPDELRGQKLRRVQKVQLNDINPASPLHCANMGMKGSRTKITRRSVRTLFLREGETHHLVWRPKKRPELAKLVDMLEKGKREHLLANNSDEDSTPVPSTPKSAGTINTGCGGLASLRSRQQTLFNRVIATQAVLKETTDELLKEDSLEANNKQKHISLLEASKKVTASIKHKKVSNKDVSDIVAQYLAKNMEEEQQTENTGTKGGQAPTEPDIRRASAPMAMGPPRKLLQRRETKGAIPINALREIIREKRLSTALSETDQPDSPGPFQFSPDNSDHFRTPSPIHPPGRLPTLVEEMVGPMDAPLSMAAVPKLNKMAKLKKSVADRHLQRQDLNVKDVLSNGNIIDSATPPQSYTHNTNNSSNDPSGTTSAMGVVLTDNQAVYNESGEEDNPTRTDSFV